jgi:hypothetical protein
MRVWTLAAAFAFVGCGFAGEDPFAGARLPDVAPWQDIGPLTFCESDRRIGPLALGAGGLCRAGGTFQPCATDGDCRSRERCVCGGCTVALCDAADECGPGIDRTCSFDDRRCDRPCQADRDCAAGETCLAGRHVCRGTCAVDDDCQTGESCRRATGECITTTCVSNDDCTGARSCGLQRVPAQLAHPTPIIEHDTITLWLERTDAAPGSTTALWRARSIDGRQFRFDPGAALFPGRAPTVATWPDHGYLMLFASGSGIGRANSVDGARWQVDSVAALRNADEPSLVRLGDRFIAYYTEADPNVSGGRRLARALSDDGVAFSPAGAVLAPAQIASPTLWRDVDGIAAPFAEVRLGANGSDVVRLWFAARGLESAPSLQLGRLVPTPADWSIGEAGSTDGGATFVVYPFNPVFDRVLDFLTHPSELDPAVITWHGTDWMFYRRAAADGTQPENLALARSPALPR